MMRHVTTILAVSIVLSMGALADDVLRIVHLTDPVLPDETVVLMGGVFSADTQVQIRPMGGKWQAADILQRDDVSMQFVVPKELPFGAYEVRVTEGGRVSDVAGLNIPRVRWIQGDKGLDGSPGGFARVFGLGVSFAGYDPSIKNAPASRVKLKHLVTGAETVLPATPVSCFSLKVDLPADLPEGTYAVSVNNGYGDAFYGNPSETLKVAADNWPTTVFNARELGGVEKALDAARANGGGIVYLPKGIYEMQHLYPWIVPDKTILRGDGKEETFVTYVGLNEDVDDALITGRNFAMESMSVRVFRNFEKVVEVNRTSRFWAKDLQVVAVCFGNDIMSVKGDVAYRGRRVWAALDHVRYVFQFMQGSNISVTGCSFIAPKCMAVEGYEVNGLISQNNQIHTQYGPARAMFASRNGRISRRIIHEDCNCTMHAPVVDKFFMRNCLFFGDFSSTDRDGMTTDCSSCAYAGKIAGTNGNKVELAENVRDIFQKDFQDFYAIIIQGRGAGQFRYATRTGEHEAVLNAPFDIEPDATSLLIIQSPGGDHIYVDNDLQDCGRIQFYGAAANMLVHGNKMTRMGGVNNWPGTGAISAEHGVEVFNQVTNNRMVGKTPVKKRGGIFRIMCDHRGRGGQPVTRHVLGQGIIVRRNDIVDSQGVFVQGMANNSIVEKNAFADEEKGVEVFYGRPDWKTDKTLIPGQLLLRDNIFRNVQHPYLGEAIGEALILPAPEK